VSHKLSVVAVAVVSFALGGLVSQSAQKARADAAQPAPGKCVSVAAVGAAPHSFLFRAFEDGTVEMSRYSSATANYGHWEKAAQFVGPPPH
jgi:hypothetical protein